MKKPFKILCIDGGGIKGLYSAKVLSVFEETYKTLCSNHFDLICGTSTGGIIALAITQKIQMRDIVEFYRKYGPGIFSNKNKKKRSPINAIYFSLRQVLFCSKYSQKQLKDALQQRFGNKKIKDSENLLCIPAYNMTSANPRIFKKDYGNFNQDDNKTYVEIALATTAAPTYFPVVEIDHTMYADGGLYANDPTLVGLTEAIYNWIKPKEERVGGDYDGVQILSISSLEKACGETPGRKNRSFWNWKNTLFDAYTISQNKTTQFFLNKIKNHLNFELEIIRVVNNPLSSGQSQLIEMDNVSDESLVLLYSIGNQTGMDYKDTEKIKEFFSTKKTINVNVSSTNSK